ncbi:MAG TPA: hypothetical protein VIO38_09745 [Rariglobus sp.]
MISPTEESGSEKKGGGAKKAAEAWGKKRKRGAVEKGRGKDSAGTIVPGKGK